MVKVKSSNIAAIEHTDDILRVEFVNGRIYDYANVPASVYDALLKEAEKVDGSVGKVFNRIIRANSDAFPFTEVEEDA